MTNSTDYRDPKHGNRFKMYVRTIESIETTGKNADYIIRQHNGTESIFRCSCCITFSPDGKYLFIG